MAASKVLPLLTLLLVLIACTAGAGCASTQKTDTQKTYGTAVIDMRTIDPENADIWPTMDINLWKYPGGLAVDGQEIVAKIPSCQGIEVDIIEITDYEGLTYYKIRYGEKEGWVTKRLITGEE